MNNQSTSQSSFTTMSDSIMSTDIDDEIRLPFMEIHKMSKEELLDAVENCKLLISESDDMSIQRKWLIRKLVDMRYRLAHVMIERDDSKGEVNIFGHEFRPVKQIPSKRLFCDFCTNCIWVFQEYSACVSCFFVAHVKCIKHVTRICSNITVCEKGIPELRICPEIGISMQMYRCAECQIPLLNKQCFMEPRKCHYTGLYFCKTCHWVNYSIIPANIIHNWDFEQRPVSRKALQEINLFYERPVIKLEELNVKLFVFVQKLGAVKAKRIQLMEMKKYLDACRIAVNERIINENIGSRRYLAEGTEFYSVYDLVCVENNSLLDYLSGIFNIFKAHIADCQVRTQY